MKPRARVAELAVLVLGLQGAGCAQTDLVAISRGSQPSAGAGAGVGGKAGVDVGGEGGEGGEGLTPPTVRAALRRP